MGLTTGLISYWKMDEASGNALDAHGSNPLTDNNSVGSATGIINNARHFIAISSKYLSHASNSDLQAGDIDFTFAAWINAASLGTMVILAKDVDSPANSRDYTLDYSSGLRFYTNGGAGGVAYGPALSVGVWSYVIAWHDSVADTINMQVDNGTPATNATAGVAPNVSSAEFRIGARAYSGFEGYWDGDIDEVGFWKRVLTTQERTDLYNGGAGLAYPFGAATGGGPLIGGGLTKGSLIRGGRLAA